MKTEMIGHFPGRFAVAASNVDLTTVINDAMATIRNADGLHRGFVVAKDGDIGMVRLTTKAHMMAKGLIRMGTVIVDVMFGVDDSGAECFLRVTADVTI